MSRSNAPPYEKSVAAKAGIAGIRHLTVQPPPSNKKETSSKTPQLPDGWYFNEKQEQQFWDEMETSTASKTTQIQNDLLRHTEQVADIQDTSGKIRSLISQMDDIDQDTLTQLMHIYEEGQKTDEAFDRNEILSDSKLSVSEFIDELKELSISQAKLVEALRFWFSTISQHSNIEDDNFDLRELPTVDAISNQLTDIFVEYNQKSEQISCLHSEMNEYWFKQVSNYKRAILQRDEEITKLHKQVDKANDQARHARKKIEQVVNIPNDSAIYKDQLEQQLRLNQEQKQQIEQLKKALHQAETEKAALSSLTIHDKSLNNDYYEQQAEFNTFKLEYESKLTNQAQIIDELRKTIESQRNRIDESQRKVNELETSKKNLQEENDHLSQQIQKLIQLLELEKEKNLKASLNPQEETTVINPEELYEEKLKHQEEIKALENRHRQELLQQSEIIRAKYLKEREKLLSAIDNNDSSTLVKTISDECNKKIIPLMRLCIRYSSTKTLK